MKRMINASYEDADLTELEAGMLAAIEEGKAYDFVANNYYRMDRRDLKDVLLEALYLLPDSDNEALLEGVKDRWIL